jgi:hypothetical protein
MAAAPDAQAGEQAHLVPLSPRQWRRIAAHIERTSPVPRWLATSARLHIQGRCNDCRT